MNILHIISSLDPKGGGVSQVLRDYLPALKTLGVSGEVLTVDAIHTKFLEEYPFKVTAIGPGRGPYAYSNKLSGWLKDNLLRFDVLIIHGLWQYNNFGTYKSWKRIKQSSPKAPALFIMPHGMLDPYFQKAAGRKLKALRNTFFWKFLEEKAINNADGILFTCEEELLLARKNFKPYAPKGELNVGLGTTPPPKFQPKFETAFINKIPELNGKPYWLFLSRIHPKKGVDLLIEAYLALLATNHNLPELVIAGPGLDSDFGKGMLKIGQHRNIYFPGMLKGDTKWGAFYGCEAFVLPSHQENFGIAVAEAMACKKPVLISNQVNIWREIEQGKGGLIFDDSEKGVFEALAKFLKLTKDQKNTTGENAYNTYLDHFSIKKAAQKMLDQLNLAVGKTMKNFDE